MPSLKLAWRVWAHWFAWASERGRERAWHALNGCRGILWRRICWNPDPCLSIHSVTSLPGSCG
eukprot:3845604-Amphidinium_carterae.2